MASAAALSVAHPPGYPVFTLVYFALSNIFHSVGLTADRCKGLHSVSALFGCGTVLLLFIAQWHSFALHSHDALSSAQCLLSSIVCAVMSWNFAVAPVIVKYSTQAEVFALNHFLLAGFLVSFVQFCKAEAAPQRRRLIVSMCLWAGLCMSHQQASMFVVAPLAAVALCSVTFHRQFDTRCLFLAFFVAVACGCVPYAWLYVASHWCPHRYSWGGTDTLAGLVSHVLRRNYGTFQLHAGGLESNSTTVGTLLRAQSQFTSDNVGAAVVWIVACGLACDTLQFCIGTRRSLRTQLGLVLVACGVVGSCGFASLSNLPLDHPIYKTVYERFWQQQLLPLSVAAAWWLHRGLSGLGSRQGFLVLPLCIVLLGSAPNGLFPWAPAESKAQHEHLLYAYGQASLEGLPSSAIVVTSGDVHVTSLRFLQTVMKLREDVIHVDNELFTYCWCKRAAQEHFRDVVWPTPSMACDDTVGSGASIDITMLTRLNSAESKRRVPCGRAGTGSCVAPARRVFVVETPRMSSQKEAWQQAGLWVKPVGFFYELRPKPPSLSRICSSLLANGTRHFVHSTVLQSFVQLLQAKAPASGQQTECFVATPFSWGQEERFPCMLLRFNYSEYATERPWEATVIELYFVAIRNELLEAADLVQQCSGATNSGAAWTADVARGLYRKLLHVSEAWLLPHRFSVEVYRMHVAPFLALLRAVCRG